MAYPASFPVISYTDAATGEDIALVTEVRTLLAEPVARDFTDAQIQEFLDRGASIAARKSKCAETGQAFITLVTAQRDYGLPTLLFTAPDDYSIEIDSVFYYGAVVGTGAVEVDPAAARGLIKFNKRQLGNLAQNTAGPPVYWCPSNEDGDSRKITIWPVPAAGQNNFLCEVFFYRVANVLKAADSSATHFLPEYLRELPIWYAISEAFRSVGKVGQAEQYRAYFDNLVSFFRQDRFDRVHDVDSKADMKQADFTQVA